MASLTPEAFVKRWADSALTDESILKNLLALNLDSSADG